ncbi:MAG TPA: endonuclease/exonuclease/phosphatase family protein [Methylomirabilota bacterium]|nr:endonuclease/exonuclease/phosphatase family protein [Methylomirabilota bacterium]
MRLAAALALCAGLVAGAPVLASESPGRPLRVVTFNMFHGGAASGLNGNTARLDTRLDLAVRELRALDPDIIALQEASAGPRRGDVVARMAAELRLNHIHAPATSRVFSLGPANQFVVWLIGFAEGPAILSRFPIAGSEVYDLPRCQRALDPRVLLRVVVTTPRGPLDVYSTHTTRDTCQHRRVAELVAARRGPLPAVVMGDFNAVEGGEGMAALADAGLVDAFRAANPTGTGSTVWQQIEAPASTVFRRVDYVLVLPGTAMAVRVRASRIVLDTPGRLANGGVLWPSDHYGVLADLELVEQR